MLEIATVTNGTVFLNYQANNESHKTTSANVNSNKAPVKQNQITFELATANKDLAQVMVNKDLLINCTDGTTQDNKSFYLAPATNGNRFALDNKLKHGTNCI